MKTNVQIEIGLTHARKVIDIIHDRGLLDNGKIKVTSTNTYLVNNIEIETMVDCEYWDEFNNFILILEDEGIEYEVEHL